MRSAQQIRKEIVEQKYHEVLSKIEEAIDNNKHNYYVEVPQNGSDINACEIEQYMKDLGYGCEFEWISDVGFGFKISW